MEHYHRRNEDQEGAPRSTGNCPDAGWKFDNSYGRLPQAFHVRLNPVSVRSPKLVVLNAALARFLGLNPDALNGDEGAAVFSGNRIPEGAEPLAQAYAGHQFGSFTMLGDGRAVLLGEQTTPEGERFDIQYKGSGRTPFSRQGDGRAALGLLDFLAEPYEDPPQGAGYHLPPPPSAMPYRTFCGT